MFSYNSASPPVTSPPNSAHTPPSTFLADEGVVEGAAGDAPPKSGDSVPPVSEELSEVVSLVPVVAAVVPLALVSSPVYAEARRLVPFLQGGGVPVTSFLKVMSAHCRCVSGSGVVGLEFGQCFRLAVVR